MQLPFLVASLELGSNQTNPQSGESGEDRREAPRKTSAAEARQRSKECWQTHFIGRLLTDFRPRLFFVLTAPLTDELALFEERQKRVSDVMRLQICPSKGLGTLSARLLQCSVTCGQLSKTFTYPLKWISLFSSFVNAVAELTLRKGP
jgi:hypothetical protein